MLTCAHGSIDRQIAGCPGATRESDQSPIQASAGKIVGSGKSAVVAIGLTCALARGVDLPSFQAIRLDEEGKA